MLIAVRTLICVTFVASLASMLLLKVIECCAHSPQGPKPADEKIKAICAAVVEGEEEFFFSVPQEFRCSDKEVLCRTHMETNDMKSVSSI